VEKSDLLAELIYNAREPLGDNLSIVFH